MLNCAVLLAGRTRCQHSGSDGAELLQAILYSWKSFCRDIPSDQKFMTDRFPLLFPGLRRGVFLVFCSFAAICCSLTLRADDASIREMQDAAESTEIRVPYDGFSETPINALLAQNGPSTPVPEPPAASMACNPATPAETGYWIVSTERAPQSFDHTLPRFSAVVSRYEHGAGLRKTSIEELRACLQPGIPICVMVHGSLVGDRSVEPESFRTWQWLRHGARGRPFQMIYFRWPSYKLLTPLLSIDFAILGRRASRNGFYLAGLIKSLPPESPLSLLGHSHGTRVISSALHLMAGGAVEEMACPQLQCAGRQIRTVFAASAIDHDWLNPGERFERALCSTECLLNLRNPFDAALVMYPLRRIGSSRALGVTGLTEKDRSALGNSHRKVRDLDVSESVGCRHFWPSYVEQTGLARAASNYLFYP